ncbi:GlcG/HbpS family heme-binding protein [Methylobacterium sp. J-090]|uniref:GlcG/HbpS family heme-binding protein n=1 Tax=Methylobacterium sp. J-090 TaxID=2836666 RepID=UPI001FBA4867|nr:heme-binding protein [Methylobacterium sp. J-090]MCJ2083698.1 heme-binding protein [Methylobacterium sp. J-090]
MTDLSLAAAQTLVAKALEAGRGHGLKPLVVVVFDARGALKALAAEDGTSLRRAEIAMGKANGALALGLGSRAIAKRAADDPTFIAAVSHVVGPAALVPVPGGVLIRDGAAVIGAVGISGDTSDNDELCAVAGIEAAGFSAQTGA